MATDLDDYATVELDTLLGALDNFVSDSDSVTSLELWDCLPVANASSATLIKSIFVIND